MVQSAPFFCRVVLLLLGALVVRDHMVTLFCPKLLALQSRINSLPRKGLFFPKKIPAGQMGVSKSFFVNFTMGLLLLLCHRIPATFWGRVNLRVPCTHGTDLKPANKNTIGPTASTFQCFFPLFPACWTGFSAFCRFRAVSRCSGPLTGPCADSP